MPRVITVDGAVRGCFAEMMGVEQGLQEQVTCAQLEHSRETLSRIEEEREESWKRQKSDEFGADIEVRWMTLTMITE